MTGWAIRGRSAAAGTPIEPDDATPASRESASSAPSSPRLSVAEPEGRARSGGAQIARLGSFEAAVLKSLAETGDL